MTPPLDPDLVAAHAVGALDGAEATALGAALDREPAARAALAEHHRTLAALAALDPTEPPAAVWAGIRARLAERPPHRSASVHRDHPFSEGTFTLLRRSEPEDWHHDSPPPSMAPGAPVHGEARRGRAPWGPRVRLALAAAAVAALGLVGLGLVTRDPTPPTLAEVAAGALDDPAARQAALTGPGSDRVVGRAAVWASGTGCVVVEDLPPLPPGEVYQLWMLGGGAAPPISLGFVDPATAGGVAVVTLDPAATGLAVSREPAGGAVAPSSLVATGSFDRG